LIGLTQETFPKVLVAAIVYKEFSRAAPPHGAAGKGDEVSRAMHRQKFGGFREIQGQLEHSAGQVVAGEEEVQFDVAAGAGERIPRRREAAWPLA